MLDPAPAARTQQRWFHMTTDIKRTAERIPLEVLNGSNFALLDELLAPNFVEHSPQPGVKPTREGLKQTLVGLKTAFPDLRYTIEDAIECGDQIVHRLSATGTMTGEFMGIPATGKKATWTEIHIGRGVDGRLTEHWGLVDQLGMLVQLGVVPSPARVPVTV
jgi:predicted ester cyclase